MLMFCIIICIICSVIFLIADGEKNKIISLSMDEIDAMEGHQFEYYTARMLRYSGFQNVEVTKGSGDYGVDVTAYKNGHKWAFQCKRYSKNLGLKPIQEVYAGAKRYNADKAVVFTNVYFTPNAQSLADTLHVELWDRDHLKNMIWNQQQEETAKIMFQKSKAAKKGTTHPEVTEKAKISTETPAEVIGSVATSIDSKDTASFQSIEIKSEKTVEPKLENDLMQILYPIKSEDFSSIEKSENSEHKQGDTMSTIIGAGKYTFGENIPMGCYDLTVVSGSGTLKIQIGEGNDFDDKWQNMGIGIKGFAETYNGISLPKGWFFSLDGDLKVEITKSKMIEIK